MVLYVMRSNGQIEQLPNTWGVAKADGVLVAEDSRGRKVREYPRGSVLVFGYDERVEELARYMKTAPLTIA